ncbi:hypothetical protein NP493_233g00022 [Ridgeia piscesae]|uniref:G-protein coupled receptors family 1 profile domain-containing protein n=1 Tax=Ridgeia piscesae TaxID=27915 RepID=A0AAD9NZP2_RIDPI|nr:hypothetical protein NP493_233g00022 [Ridgeia piscesae]
MTSSTRVYMFALAVADSCVCVCGIVLTTTWIEAITAAVVSVTILTGAITFSMLLLVFVSIERLIAVRRPQTFNMNPTRAKRYILGLFFIAVLFTTVQGLASYMNYTVFLAFVRTSFLTANALIMVTCYTLIGATLLTKVRNSRKQIADINIQLSRQSTNPTNSNLTFAIVQSDVIQSPPISDVTRIIAKQTQNVKSIALLFIITVVFVVCWMPVLLRVLGVKVSQDVTHLYVVNSVVNPFIYGVASAMFREDVRQFYRQTRTKLSACYT